MRRAPALRIRASRARALERRGPKPCRGECETARDQAHRTSASRQAEWDRWRSGRDGMRAAATNSGHLARQAAQQRLDLGCSSKEKRRELGPAFFNGLGFSNDCLRRDLACADRARYLAIGGNSSATELASRAARPPAAERPAHRRTNSLP